MKKKGVVLSFKNREELKKDVNILMKDKTLRENMEKNAQTLKSNAVEKIAQLILSQPKADYSKLLRENIVLSKVNTNVKRALASINKRELKNSRAELKTNKLIRQNII